MKLFRTNQIKQLDQYTIEHEPISSIDLMERAADALYWKFINNFPNLQPICIVAGPGNNGGDALALGRMLLLSGYSVSVYLIHTNTLSSDCEINEKRLLDKFPQSLHEMINSFKKPEITKSTIIVDGLFGSGLSRPLDGIYAEAVYWMNSTGCKIVAIDIPSGLNGEENSMEDASNIVEANYTYSIQFPKLSFLFSENEKFVGKWCTVDIAIHPEAIKLTESNLYYLENNEISNLLKKRQKFSHKGTFGHTYIISGSIGMAGAAVLCSKAALRSGTGLVTIHSAAANRVIVQSVVPEAIFQADTSNDFISEIKSIEQYNAIAIGPGIGTNSETTKMLIEFLENYNKPCILDADALNIISQNKDLLSIIPKNSILTPHPKEFERLFGKCNSSFERMKKAAEAAQKLGIIIVLKGAYTLISTPDGKQYFNSTGNSGMATAGSGDVLTGIVTSLLAQDYLPENAAKIGVYIHGLAGNIALEKQSTESLIASDIIENIGLAFIQTRIENKY